MKKLLIALTLLSPLPAFAETGGYEIASEEVKMVSQRVCKHFVDNNVEKITYNQYDIYRGVVAKPNGYISLFCIDSVLFLREYIY
jgi:hypothetical protein